MADAAQQPLTLNSVLPSGLDVDQLLIAGSLVVIVAMGWFFFAKTSDRYAPRIRAIQQRRAELKEQITAPTRRRARPGDSSTMTLVRQVVSTLKLLQQHQVDQLEGKLINAGYRSKDAIIVFAFAKLVMPFLGLGVGLLVGNIDWSNAFSVSQSVGWLKVLGIAYFGARLPEILVANARSKRYAALRKGLPDALDLMMICAEAGLSLAAALDRVSKELARVSPELAEEFGLTSVELGFLPDRSVALKHLHERANLPEIRGFVNVIAQTEKYGTPIAQALRVLSKEFRTQRMLAAEQKAARLPAMMTVPMIIFILPTLFIIVMAPAVISIMDNF